MIVALNPQVDGTAGFIIGPNPSMSWQGQLLAYCVIVVFSLAIAISFYLIGLTFILPFSGLELLALGAALYITAWRTGQREVILLTEDQIIVEKGRNGPEQREEFSRHWARVILERSWNHWYPCRLFIRSHGRQIEIGRFLNEQERSGLAQELIATLNNLDKKKSSSTNNY